MLVGIARRLRSLSDNVSETTRFRSRGLDALHEVREDVESSAFRTRSDVVSEPEKESVECLFQIATLEFKSFAKDVDFVFADSVERRFRKSAYRIGVRTLFFRFIDSAVPLEFDSRVHRGEFQVNLRFEDRWLRDLPNLESRVRLFGNLLVSGLASALVNHGMFGADATRMVSDFARYFAEEMPGAVVAYRARCEERKGTLHYVPVLGDPPIGEEVPKPRHGRSPKAPRTA